MQERNGWQVGVIWRSNGQMGSGRAAGRGDPAGRRGWRVLPERGAAAGAGAARGLARVQEKKLGMRWKFFEGWGEKKRGKDCRRLPFFCGTMELSEEEDHHGNLLPWWDRKGQPRRRHWPAGQNKS